MTRVRKQTKKRFRYAVIAAVIIVVIAVATRYLMSMNIAVLNPAGPVADQERGLMEFAVLLALTVVVPVFALLIGFAWRYREGNTKAKYSPNLDRNKFAEITWWLIPGILISILSVVAWNSSHSLDPYRPLTSTVKPITIQVVALDWKWLFIYPQQNIATVNYIQFPKQTPINFQVTSDAPMNSFWIPQLGGQIYAMPGMSTELHLMASKEGSYRGLSANISGEGFSGMTFVAKASTQTDFLNWVQSIQRAGKSLSLAEYTSLAKPSENNSVDYYASVDSSLYNTIVDKYMASISSGTSTTTNPKTSSSAKSMQSMVTK